MVDPVGNNLSLIFLLAIDDLFEIPDSISVACFKCLDVLYDFIFNVCWIHPRLEDKFNKLLKLDVFGRDVLVS